jgi:hypothetical protein
VMSAVTVRVVTVLFHEESSAQDSRNLPLGLLIKDRAAPSSPARALLRSPTSHWHLAPCETDVRGCIEQDQEFASAKSRHSLEVVELNRCKLPCCGA